MRWWLLAMALAVACGGGDGDPQPTSHDAGATAPATGNATGTTTTGDDGDTEAPPLDTTTGAADVTGSSGAPATTGDDCLVPAFDAAWIEPYQTDLVARLAGAAELTPGVTLADRATPMRRDQTRQFLLAELDALGLTSMLHTYGDADGANVWVGIPATEDTNETLVFGAHFDTVPSSPGANDNATGVALALSLARWLAQVPCRTRNVIIVLFDQEEIGLLGSAAFAQFLVSQPFDVLAVHTVDQMGWDDDGDRTIELERPDTGLARQYDAAASGLQPPVPTTVTQTGSTDHVSFRALGFDAIGLTEEFVSSDTTPHYHLPSDTFETVDFGYLHSTSVLVHATFGALVAP